MVYSSTKYLVKSEHSKCPGASSRRKAVQPERWWWRLGTVNSASGRRMDSGGTLMMKNCLRVGRVGGIFWFRHSSFGQTNLHVLS